jgi:signal transduction histidine kinase
MMPDMHGQRSIESSHGGSFGFQQSIFAVLNLIVLASLLLIHTLFANHFGAPSATLIILLAAAFLVRLAELAWAQGSSRAPSSNVIAGITLMSIASNLALAFVLATLADRPDHQYFVLLAMPIIEAAFRFPLPATIATIVAADLLNCIWLLNYDRRHGPVNVSEYFEAGTVDMIYAIVGLLVWFLVTDLRNKETSLARNLAELETTRERLLQEEKLAAVGRLSSAIAHEIRNPVAMISSSLAMAVKSECDPQERDEMFEIAAKEASRLDRFTNDFLSYAKPRAPEKILQSVGDQLLYVADICRARARERKVEIEVIRHRDITAEFDSAQVQQVLLNLVLNAIDATPAQGRVRLSAVEDQPGSFITMVVENTGEPMPAEIAMRLFEPFFTTKPAGTGLGLAIARNIAIAHGGELQLTGNCPDQIQFSLTLPARHAALAQKVGG